MDLVQAEALARSLLDWWGLNDWTFGWDRAKRRFGHCLHDDSLITVSKPLTLLNPRWCFEDTVKHEIAHAQVGYEAGHGPTWQEMAVRVGAIPKATVTVELPASPFTYACARGHNFGRLRRIKDLSAYSCSRCASGFNPDYPVSLVSTKES